MTTPHSVYVKQVDIMTAPYTKDMKALTQSLVKSNFAEHIFNTHHNYTNVET